MLSKYDRKYLTYEEREAIREATKKYNSCREPETAALFHLEAEKIRARHGYSGGLRGKRYIPLKKDSLIDASV